MEDIVLVQQIRDTDINGASNNLTDPSVNVPYTYKQSQRDKICRIRNYKCGNEVNELFPALLRTPKRVAPIVPVVSTSRSEKWYLDKIQTVAHKSVISAYVRFGQ